MIKVLVDVLARLREGQMTYLYCGDGWRGTGVAAACTLGLVHPDMSAAEACEAAVAFARQRGDHGGEASDLSVRHRKSAETVINGARVGAFKAMGLVAPTRTL